MSRVKAEGMGQGLGEVLGRAVVVLLAPAVLLAGGGWLSAHPSLLPPGVWSLMDKAPYAASLLGALLAWRFKRSRVVFLLALAALGFWLSRHWFALPGESLHGHLAHAAFAVLLPLNTLLVAGAGDRGVFTGRGLALGLLMAAQVLAVAFVVGGGWGWLDPGASVRLQVEAQVRLDAFLAPPAWSSWTPLTQPALVSFLLALVLLLGRAALRDQPMDGGFLGALAAMGLALHGQGGAYAPVVQATLAGVVLMAATVQDSWRMAFLDELTGLPGRRALMADTRGLGGRYVMAMVDVDHFKKFNDTYGHDTGDDVLRMVATRLAKVGGGGTSYRYGGEEFTVVFPRGTAEQAAPHLENLRRSIEESGFRIRNRTVKAKGGSQGAAKGKGKAGKGAERTVRVTVSIGAAERSDAAPGVAEVLKAADKLLYKAKKTGRNKVVV